MIFDDEEKCYRLGHEVLRHYRERFGAECSLRLLQLSENVTYLVENRRKPLAVLRLCRPGYHTWEELQAEMQWMEELGERVCGVKLRQPIRTDEGHYLCGAEDGTGQVCFGTAFTYLSGIPLEELPCEQQLPWFEKLGEATAFLHCRSRERALAQRTAGLRDLPRFRWNYESMIGTKALWGDWRKVIQHNLPDTALYAEKEIMIHKNIFDKADGLICNKLKEYGMTENTYGLIHGDLRGANLLVDKDTLGIIDFDDCGYGWDMQDLAASLSFQEAEEEVPQLIKAWCRGYRKLGTLRQADMDMIDTFILMRRLQLLAWIHSRRRAASARRYRENFLCDTVRLADQYIQIRG